MRLKNIMALALALAAAGDVFAQREPIVLDSLAVTYYVEGLKLAAQKEPARALVWFDRALQAEPGHDPSLFAAADALAALGNVARALEYSSRAVAIDPGNRWYTGQHARLLVGLERYNEALALFESMIGRGARGFDPDDYRMLAMLYYQKGRTDDAVATLDSAEVRMGMTPEIVEMKRGILIDAGRIDDAVRETEKYVAATPYDEANRLALAEIYAYQGRDSLQMVKLREILAVNPDNADALRILAGLYSGKGQTALYFSTLKQLFMHEDVPLAEKTERFEMLVRNTNLYRQHFLEIGDLAAVLATRHPGDAGVMGLYADHAVRSGDAEGALAIMKTQLGRSEKPDLSTFMKVMEIETYLQRADSVALYGDRALALYPEKVDIYMFRSSALQFMGRVKEARKTLVRALRTAGTDSLRSEIHGAIGTMWHEEGNNRKTFAEYEKALAYNSNNVLVLNNYAYFLALEGRELDRALGMASRAIKLQENFATYLDTYAWVLYKTGNYAEAKKTMQQALPLDRDNSPELLMHYGDILWALGEDFMASVYWKRARDAGYEPAGEIEERLARTQ